MLPNKQIILCLILMNNLLPKIGKRMDDGIHWTSPGVRFQVSIICQVVKIGHSVADCDFKNPY